MDGKSIRPASIVRRRTVCALAAMCSVVLICPPVHPQTLQPGDTITVSIGPILPPLYYLGVDGQPLGFVPDLLREAAARAQVNIEFELVPDYQTLQSLDPENHPLVTWLLAEECPEGYMEFERAYLTLHAAAFRRKTSPFHTDIRAAQLGEVIVVHNSEVERDLLNNAWDSLHPVATVEEALQLLAGGSYDTVLVSQFPGHYAIEQLGLDTIRAVNSTEMHMHQHLKLLRTRYRTDLERSLAPALASIREDGTHDRLYTKWFGKYEAGYVPVSWFKWTIAVAVAILFVLALSFVLTHQRFRKRITSQGLALESSEQRLAELMQSVEAIVWEASLDARFSFVSQYAEKLLGYPVDQWYIQGFFADTLLHPDDRDQTVKTCHQASIRGEDHVLDYRARTASGQIIWLHDIVRVIKDESGRPVKLHGVMIDVTERKQAELAIAKSEARLAATIAASPTGIVRLDPQGHVTFSNQEAQRITGLHTGPVDMRRWLDAVHPDDRDIVRNAWRHLSQSPGHDMREYRFRHADGTIVWVLDRGHPETDAHGNFAGFVATLTDITALKRAEETIQLHSQVLMHLSEAVNFTDETGIILYTNAAFDRMFGYPPGELIGKSIATLNHVSEQAYDRLSAEISAALASTGSWSGEFHNRHRSGREFWSRAHIFRIEGIGQKLVVCVQTDITEGRRAELALRESEERFRRVAESALVGIAIFDGERFVFSNNSMLEIVGYSPEELVGLSREGIARLFLPDDAHLPVFGSLQRLDTEKAAEGPVIFNELRIRRKDGSIRYVNLIVTRLYPDKPFPRMFLCADVTDRVCGAAALRESEEKFRRVAETAFVGLAIHDGERFVYGNDAMSRITGYPFHELATLSRPQIVQTLFYESDFERVISNLEALDQPSTDCQPVVFEEIRLRHKDGGTRWVSLIFSRLYPEQPMPRLTICMDITARRRAEDALRESEALFRAITEQMPDAVFLIDFSDPAIPGEIVYANESAARMHGMTVDEIIGKSISELDDPATARHISERRARMLSGETIHFEGLHRRKDGSVFPVEVVARRVDALGDRICLAIDRDITERKRLENERQAIEQRMLQAQKLESLGILAGGIAHDFNNLLVGILGNADLAQNDVPEGSPAAVSLEQIQIAAKRAAELTHQMLAYSGKGKFVVQRIQIDSLVREMAKLLDLSLSKHAVLRFELDCGAQVIEGDASQIRQVVMNLITNASDALGENAGVITLRSGVARYSAEALNRYALGEPLAPGHYVYLEVSDTGCGMDEDTVQRIFDPFFTTKFAGRGLGLASVLGIVRSHRGGLHVTSRPGAGTSFRVIFPAAPPESVPETEPSNGHPAHENGHGNGHTGGLILVVDDEPRVRDLISRALDRFGYSVLAAHNGAAAVDAFRSRSGDVRAAVIDLTMPGMNGDEVLAVIRTLRPDLPALFVSGYAGVDLTSNTPGKGPIAFLQKPFTIEALRLSMESLLNESRSAYPS